MRTTTNRNRNVKKLLVMGAAVVSAALAWAEALTFSIAADRTNALYQCGQTATFTVTAMNAAGQNVSSGRVDYVVDNFGPCKVGEGQIDLARSNPFTVTGTLAEPGFLRLNLRTPDNARPTVFGVGYEPEKLEKGSPSPADFDAFWAQAVAHLDATVPADPQLQFQADRSTGAFNFWRISFATWGGTRVYGFLSIPKDAAATKKYPVRFQVPAAGEGGWTNDMQGAPDAICMLITVHPFVPARDLAELKEQHRQNAQALKARYGVGSYAAAGIAKSREDYYFYRALLGINRAVEWLCARPEVDLTDFTYSGTSQGGGFGFYLLGLSRRFTRGVMFVPAITDTMGYLKNRQSGWPRIIENQRAEEKAAAERHAPYFDGANFASRITCPVRVVVGFADTTCAPCAVYAAFNAIRSSDKKIYHGIGMGHGCWGSLYQALGVWQRTGREPNL